MGEGFVAERIRPSLAIAGLIPVHGHLDTPFSKEYNLAMLTMVAIPPPHGGLTSCLGQH